MGKLTQFRAVQAMQVVGSLLIGLVIGTAVWADTVGRSLVGVMGSNEGK